jgi:hypothetical protein
MTFAFRIDVRLEEGLNYNRNTVSKGTERWSVTCTALLLYTEVC